MNRKSGIVLAADVDDLARLRELAVDVAGDIDAVKVGNIPLYKYGWDVVRQLKDATGKPIIADLKLMDVPFIAGRIVAEAHSAGADGVMVCGSAGMDCIGVCRASFPGLLIVMTQFTHCRSTIPDSVADATVSLARKLGCDGVQVPATFPDRIRTVREAVGEEFLLFACGVGRQGAPVGSAVSNGADFEIIGREIYDPSGQYLSPKEAARSCSKKIGLQVADQPETRVWSSPIYERDSTPHSRAV